MTSPSQIDVLDLRHFPAAQLRPLLADEARRWDERLRWDYTAAVETVLEYLEGRVLPGYVALHEGRAVGYTFAVMEASKAVLGDVYALGEGGPAANPLCETLLHHQLETLQATPGLDRIESQLLLFPSGALDAPFLARGFRKVRRLFMTCTLPAASERVEMRLPSDLRLVPWSDDSYGEAGELIHLAYKAHVDAGINEQYRTVDGSLRFLHNIVRFPGCGVFDGGNSWALRETGSSAMRGLLLSSRVRADAGHITQLCVSPTLRGLGLGRALLQRCLAEFTRQGLRTVSLTVTASNAEAMRLYEQAGFSVETDFDAMVWESKD